MDSSSSNWKRILLHWANQTGFLEQNSFNLEETDIVDFFAQFSSRFTVITQNDLILFLKENYPNVEPHLDDAGQLSSGDFMYVYSLLLHYSCVKHPEEFFHKICKSFSDQIQQAIATFFNVLIKKKTFTKENVRHAIAEASPKIPLIFANINESPIRTPQAKTSPPTPSSTLLDKNNKTVNRLQSLLEAERYDKGFLELELEKNQKRLSELTKQRENHVAEIHSLKSELLSKNTENMSPNKNAQNERLEARLRNIIRDKDEEILAVKDDLDSLKAEKLLIQDKLAYSVKQVKALLNKNKENEMTVNELMEECEAKEERIKSLIETNKDLEQFIFETRNCPGNNQNDLNSSEMYDSMCRLNSSSNLSSPENLGRSVVDIQLKEKENENSHLKNIIDQMNLANAKLSKHIYGLIIQNSEVFKICNENLLIPENCELDTIIMLFENYVKKLIGSYNEANSKVQKAIREINSLNTQITIQSEKVTEREKILSVYEKEMNNMKMNILDLQDSRNRLAEANKGYEKQINEIYDFQQNLTKISDENEKLIESKTKSENSVKSITTRLEKVSLKLGESQATSSKLEKNIAELKSENELLQKNYNKIKAQLDNLHKDNKKNDSEIMTLTIKNTKISSTKETIENENKILQQQVEQLNKSELSYKESIQKLESEKQNLIDQMNLANAKLSKHIYGLIIQNSEVFKICNENLLIPENCELDTIIMLFENYVKKLIGSYNEANSKVQKAIREINSLNTQITIQSEKVTEREKILSVYEKEMNNMKMNILDLQDSRNRLAEANKGYEKQINEIYDFQQNLTKISDENEKLIESKTKSENSVKSITTRLEKVSLKLGESQATSSKLEKNIAELKSENELLQKNYNKIKAQLDNLHKDNKKNDSEIMTLTIKNTKISSTKETIENENKILQQQVEQLNKSELSYKESIQKLESEKQNLEENIEKLSITLADMKTILKTAQNENQQQIEKIENQDDKINDLQEETEELKRTCQEITENLVRRKNEGFSLRDNIKKLSNELENVREENEKLNDDLSKYLLRINFLKQDNQQLIKERDDLKESNKNTLNKIEELVLQQNANELDSEIHTKLTNEIDELNDKLNEKNARVAFLEEQINITTTGEATKVKDLLSKIEELENKLQEIDQFYKDEKALSANLKKDVSICKAKLYKERLDAGESHAKWLEEKQSILDKNNSKADEKIKEVRVDMEHKLEKMKNKMKTLYSEEVNKLKIKHEREISDYKMSVQNKYDTYETYNQKLSKEIYHLNEKMLELKKQNQFMETKLKDAELRPSFRRAGGTQNHVSSAQLLHMEDEEGEIFNNTYLADMKTGRMSPIFGRESVSAHELQYRNSIAAPHLRSTYTAQYADQQLREEDIKDNAHVNLDDSLSSLLPNGQRKKLGGTTSYKKPGPPTPSKNAGRLSFGGNETHPREILKESNSSSANTTITVRKTTPNKFRQMFLSKTKDEPFSMKSPNGKKSTDNKRINDWRCTSTPRKSGLYFDQRRQLSLMLSAASYTDDQLTSSDLKNSLEINNKNILKLKASSSCTKNIKTELFLKWREYESPYTTESGTTSDNNSPINIDTDSIPFRKQSKTKINRSASSSFKLNQRRISIGTRGQMFSNNKLPSNKLRDLIRKNAKLQRNRNFNKFRKSLTSTNSIKIRKSILDKSSITSNNDYDTKLSSIGRSSEIFDYDLKPTTIIIKEDDNNLILENFEQLIADKESTAPFNVSDANFIISSTNNSSSQANSSTQSKTLYPATIIINRKLPHLDSTKIRKDSDQNTNARETNSPPKRRLSNLFKSKKNP